MTRSHAREIAIHMIFSLSFGNMKAEELLEQQLNRERFEELSADMPLYGMYPNESSVIAAKLVMDGGVVEEVKDALWFDAMCSNSWAARHKSCLVIIGGHKFYG